MITYQISKLSINKELLVILLSKELDSIYKLIQYIQNLSQYKELGITKNEIFF